MDKIAELQTVKHFMIVNNTEISALLAKDETFSMIHEKYGAPPNWQRPQGFVSLAKIILEQQVSLASAKAHFIKLNDYLQVFTPDNILSLSDAEMRACQISRQKATYLRELSKAIINGNLDLNDLNKYPEEQVCAKLTQIKGIGKWTCDIYLMFCLQSKDIFPIGDVAVRNTIKELYGDMSHEQMEAIAGRWEPYRSLATFYLWHYYLIKRKRRAIFD